MAPLGVVLAVLFFLVLLNGVFSATEMAIATARKGRLQGRADEGHRGAVAALALQDNPNRFLGTIQVGITLVGTLASVFGAQQLEEPLGQWLGPVFGEYTHGAIFAIVVVGLSYLQLVVGELVPKRIGLQAAEAIAVVAARPMNGLAIAARPLVHVLSLTTDSILWVFRLHRPPEETVTQEDIRHLVRQGAAGGTVQAHEEDIIDSVLDLGARYVRQIRTPRTDVVGIDLDRPLDDQIEALLESGYSRFPAFRGELDRIEGLILAKDLLKATHEGGAVDLAALVRPAVLVPENAKAMQFLAQMRRARSHMGVVIGEHGSCEGIVTLEDVLEEIVGEIEDEYDEFDPDAVQGADGSWLLSGSLAVDRFKELLGIERLPHEDERRFDTLAGFVLSELGRIPRTGDALRWDAWDFLVVDMDGLRIDKIQVRPTLEA